MNVEDMLKNDIAQEVINADTDITIINDSRDYKEETINSLKEYEEISERENNTKAELDKAQAELDTLVQKVKDENKELLDRINILNQELEGFQVVEDDLKKRILETHREAYKLSEDNKKLTYNKYTSTYVAPTEKNQFDLKTFRVEEKEFWETNYDVLNKYATITPVSDYVKITNK